MSFYALFLNRELPATRVKTLLARLFGIEADAVLPLLSGSTSELYYELRLLGRAKTPRSKDPAACFFVELCVYPHGPLATVNDSERAFARAFSQESQLPVIVSAHDRLDPYRWLLFEAETVWEVDEWPEDEQTVAITVTPANKKPMLPC